MTDVEEMYPLAPVDDVLEHFGLPRTRVLLEKVSPKNVLGRKLGLRAPGEVAEAAVEEVDSAGGRLPKLPGMR